MAYADTVLSTNPSFYYRFEETSGDVLDEVSQTTTTNPGWDLTAVGPENLGSAVFPNLNGSATTPYTWPSTSTTFSIEFWVKPGASLPYAQHAVLAEDYGNEGFRCGLRDNGTVELWMNESGGAGGVDTGVLPVDAWSYVVLTFDGTNGRSYLRYEDATQVAPTLVVDSVTESSVSLSWS